MQIVSGVWREMSAKVNLAVGTGDGPVSATAAAAPNRLPPPTPTFYGDADERTPEKSNRDEECLLTKVRIFWHRKENFGGSFGW